MLAALLVMASAAWGAETAPATTDDLVRAMRLSETGRARKAAAKALGELGDPAALRPLQEAWLRSEITRSTYDLVVGRLTDAPQDEYLGVAQMDSVEAAARYHAIQQVGELGDADDAAELVALWRRAQTLHDPAAAPDRAALGQMAGHNSFDKEVFVALGGLRNADTVAFLLERVQDTVGCPTKTVAVECPARGRGPAYKAIGAIGSPDALPVLEALTQEPQALTDLRGTSTYNSLHGAFKGRRLGAIQALTAINGPDIAATERVLQLSPDDEWLWRVVIEPLAAHGAPSVAFLERTFEHGPAGLVTKSFMASSPILRERGAELVGTRFVGWFVDGARGPEPAAWCLRGGINDCRQVSVDNLGRIGDPAAAEVLWHVFDTDESGRHRRAAISALATCGSADDLPRLEALATEEADRNIAGAARKAHARISSR